MKIWPISDLHLEIEALREPLEIPDADVCVAAGDISSSCAEAVHWLAANVARSMPVVFVAGNHEFYDGGMEEGLEDGMRAAERFPDVHFLEDGEVSLGGVRFIGATLWTDFAFGAETSRDIAWNMAAAEGMVADYRKIAWRRSPYEGFTAWRSSRKHERSRRYIRARLEESRGARSVVVTHHAPHPGSSHPRYAGSPINPSFVSDLSDFIGETQPGLWIHGHVHDGWDYMADGTRILCNPRGYGDENPSFRPGLVVEV